MTVDSFQRLVARELSPSCTRIGSYAALRDGIVKSAVPKLELRKLKSQTSRSTTNDKRTVLTEARHPESKDRLGYIRFTYDKDGNGKLELTNFNASLEIRHHLYRLLYNGYSMLYV